MHTRFSHVVVSQERRTQRLFCKLADLLSAARLRNTDALVHTDAHEEENILADKPAGRPTPIQPQAHPASPNQHCFVVVASGRILWRSVRPTCAHNQSITRDHIAA